MSLLRRNIMMANASSGGVKNYLAFEAVESGTFTLTIPAAVATTSLEYVRYSTDGGESWVTAQNVDSQQVVITTPTIAVGDKVLWRGKGKRYANGASSGAYSTFTSTGKYNVSGNIMSLLYDSSFEGKVEFTISDVFTRLFNSSKIVSAENLLLPATTLKARCYQYMFSGSTIEKAPEVLPALTVLDNCYLRMFNACSKLEAAPLLPALTLGTSCYNYMFTNCNKLNYVKAMFTTEPSTSYTNGWLSNVAATGTFVKNSAATWDVSGSSGIPTGWTVETASE